LCDGCHRFTGEDSPGSFFGLERDGAPWRDWEVVMDAEVCCCKERAVMCVPLYRVRAYLRGWDADFHCPLPSHS